MRPCETVFFRSSSLRYKTQCIYIKNKYSYTYIYIYIYIYTRLSNLVTRGSRTVEDDEDLKQELQTALFSAHILHRSKDVVRKVSRKGTKSLSRWSIGQEQTTDMRSVLTASGSDVYSESAPSTVVSSLTRRGGPSDDSVRLDQLICECRQRVEAAPHLMEDACSRLELIILLTKALLREVHNMHLDLLDC